MPIRSSFAGAALACMIASSVACGGPRPRDAAGDPQRRGRDLAEDAPSRPSVPEPPRAAAQPATAGAKVTVVVRAAARAMAVDAAHLYYGDVVDDGVFAWPKAGGDPVRIARRAPVSPALAIDEGHVAWVASPGDAVLRAPLAGGATPTTLRDRGIFQSVAAQGGEVFITEALGAGGALLRVTGATAARIASFDGAPRGLVVDATHAYVVTPSKILRAPQAKGEVETLTTGIGLDWPVLTNDTLFAIADVEAGKQRYVLAVPKTGGAARTVVRDVRDAPIAVEGGELLYFDVARAQLRAMPIGGGGSRVLAEDDALGAPTAIAADAANVYVASGVRESAIIVRLPRR